MSNRKVFKLSLIAAACVAVSAPVFAGQIIGVQQAPPSPTLIDTQEYKNGFGGWNLDNVDVKIVDVDTGVEITDKVFVKSDGSYTPMVLGDSFKSYIYDRSIVTTTDGAVLVGKLGGKDWPVGEPSGIKVITTTDIADLSNGKPSSCIMSTSYYKNSDDPKNYDVDGTYIGPNLPEDGVLESANINPTVCSSPYQTHKRLKVSALPASIDDTDGTENNAIDIVLNLDTVNADLDTDGVTPLVRRYTVLQKLNNYTDSRLAGYKIELGFGVGAAFTKINTANTTLTNQLHLSIGDGTGDNFWAYEDIATFSEGLFGTDADAVPVESGYGFFSRQRALYPVALTDTATFESTGVLSANYTDIFGDWIPSTIAPSGIFFDDDSNPLTDAKLVAFWGDNPATIDTVDYQWLSGNESNFAPVDVTDLADWASNPLYSVGVIEDLLNLGLSYMVEVGDVAVITAATDIVAPVASGTITVRMVPIVSAQAVDAIPVGSEPPADLSGYVVDAPTDTTTTTSTSGGSASVMDNAGMIVALLAFLGLGGWLVRRKLAK